MKTIVRAGAGCVLLLGSALSLGADEVPGILPSGFGDAVDRDVKTVRDATAAFHSVDEARDAGYTQETDCVEKPPEGGMGYHFTKRQLRDATALWSDFAASVARVLARGGIFGIDLVPDLPVWKEYRNKVRFRGVRRGGKSRVTLVESVRQDRAKKLTVFDQEYIEQRGRERASGIR